MLWTVFRPWLVRLWVVAVVAALLLLGEWLIHGFRDRPYPPG